MDISFRTFLPPTDLSGYVKNFWQFTSYSNVQNFTHCATASVFPKITFNCRGSFHIIKDNGQKEKLYGSGVNSQTNFHCSLGSIDSRIEVFGIFLYPHALNAITGIPANILANSNLDISEIWGNAGRELEYKIISANACEDRITLACDFLRQHLNLHEDSSTSRIVSAVRDLLNGEYQRSFELASNSHLSLRQFERKFKHLTGFAPKHFERIFRFERASALVLNKEFTLSQVAHKLGYTDQAHFGHDFLRFSGLTPSNYRRIAAGDTIFLDD